MHENETVRELLEAALRKLEEPKLQPPTAEATMSTYTSASHPGLERFTIIESSQTSSGKKACYMEPDRLCVKSGACEMRGY
ncbi:MAG TPA: hypothetical protein VN937_10610 [Blastocatellia bacterium]|nr:hypothetical protein [Blastocatellia bacterium]